MNMGCDAATVKDIFFSEFATLAAAPGGVAKLRELILQLAVQGKLVPQDPDDEPANMLIERIKAERARLVKEGVMRELKPLPPVVEDGAPFVVPAGWVWTRIGEIALVKGGKRLPKGHDFSPRPTNHIYIRVTNMKNGTIVDDNLEYIDVATSQKIQNYTISKDDLYVTIAGTIGQIGEVPKKFDGMCLTENAAKIVFKNISKRFFRYVISSEFIQIQFLDKTNQLAQPKLALKRIAETAIPLPPLPEQHRIAEKVDALMALCDDLEARQATQQGMHGMLGTVALASLAEAEDATAFDAAWARICEDFDLIFDTLESVAVFRQASMQLAVRGKLVPQDMADEPASVLLERILAEKARLAKEGVIRESKPLPPVVDCEMPYVVPEGWEWVRLGLLIGSLTNGIYKPAKYYSEDGVACLRMYNINGGKINFNNLKRMDLNDSEIEQYLLKENDLLVNRVNSRELVGKAAVIKNAYETLVFESKNIRVRFIKGGILSEYANILFQTEEIRAVFEGDAKQTCGQASISQPQISGIATPLPPLAEQRRIVQKVDALMALCDELEARIRKRQEVQARLLEAVVAEMAVQG